jgi:hypothetical protein
MSDKQAQTDRITATCHIDITPDDFALIPLVLNKFDKTNLDMVDLRKAVPFRSVPFRSVPFRSVPFRSVPDSEDHPCPHLHFINTFNG